MPATNKDLVPGTLYDSGFGGTGFPWAEEPTALKVSDAVNTPGDPTFGLGRGSIITPRTFYAEYRFANIPISLASIASLRLCAWVMFTGTADTFDTDVSGMARLPGSSFGAGDDYYTAPVVLTSNLAALEVFQLLEFAAWTVNPATSVPWEKSDLASGAFGVRFELPATAGALNPSFKLGRFFGVLEATSIAADSSAVRVAGSTVLWEFSRAREPVKIVGPGDLADIGMMELFQLTHQRGRRPNGPGWGRKVWQRGQILTLSKSDDLIADRVSIVGENRRHRLVGLWLPGLTNVGHSLDGQGLPILHSGGGPPTCERAQIKWIESPGNPSNYVLRAVTEDLLAHDRRGMAVESGDDTNLILNSSFSQGTGNVFDNWTNGESGTGTVTAEIGHVGVDETGFQRAVKVDVGITDTSVAVVEQVPAVGDDCRLAIRTYNAFGAGKLGVVIQRGADAKYWNDGAETWDVAAVFNRIGNDAGGYKNWLSKLITSGADTLTITIGYFGEAGSVFGGIGFFAYIWSVDLIEGTDHVGTPIVTTTTAVARIEDIVPIPNNSVGRWWGHELGGLSWAMGFSPLWNAADMATAGIRIFLHVDYGNGNYAQVGFEKAHDAIPSRYIFSFLVSAVAYQSYFDVTDRPDLEPVRDRVVKLSGYLTGSLGEQDRTAWSFNLAVNDEWSDQPGQLVGQPAMDPVSTGYLGHAWSGGGEGGTPLAHADGFLRQVRVVPIVLPVEELERLPS